MVEPEDVVDDAERTQVLSQKDMKPLPGRAAELAPVITVIAGRATGRTTRLPEGELLLGRAPELTLSFADPGVSRRHARIVYDGARAWVEDLGSTNGTWVNDVSITAPTALTDGDCVRLGVACAMRFGLRSVLEGEVQERLYDAATRDSLTGAYNRRFFDEALEVEWAWFKRSGNPFSVVMFDLDHFKAVNDRYGHAAGDVVLRDRGAIVRQTVRREDLFARIGGEEFVVLARTTPLQPALVLAERLRALVAAHSFQHGGARIRATLSLGVAAADASAMASGPDVVGLADQALYRAKRSGRDRVEPPARPTGSG